jgi:hypothetical protein
LQKTETRDECDHDESWNRLNDRHACLEPDVSKDEDRSTTKDWDQSK